MARKRTPTVLQMEAVECGAAALGIILGYYGTFVPLEKLRVECGVSRDGSKAVNIVKVARQYGLKASGIRANIEDLRKIKLPVILFWGFFHFLVLEGFKKDQVYINDPATGPRTISLQELNEYFTGVVLTFEPTEKLKEKQKEQTLFKAIKSRLKHCKQLLAFIFLSGLFLVIPGLIIPAFSKIFIDNILIKKLHGWLLPLFLSILFIAAIYGVLIWFQQRYLTKLNTKIAISNSAKFFHHLLRLPIDFFGQRFSGDLVYRMQLNDKMAMLLSGKLASGVINFIMIIFFAALMFTYSVMLTFIGIFSTAVSLLILKLVYRKQMDFNRRLQTESGKTLGITMRGLQIIETVKSSGAEADFFTQLSGQTAKLTNVQQELGTTVNFLNSVYPFLVMLTTTSVLIVGALQVIQGSLSVGTLVAFQALMLSFLMPVRQIFTLFQNMQLLQTDIEKLDDVFNYPKKLTFTEDKKSKGEIPKLSGNVLVKDISFGYSRLDEPLIENFNLVLKPGSRVALVGKTGSGKSTLSKVLAGLYQPWTGEVLFDNQQLKDIFKDVFSNSVAMVYQDIFLFNGTISEERVIQSAKDACIHDDIMTKLGGYSGLIEEDGKNFSGGQRQMLEIARALAGNPSILILDEATSALDAYTEKMIDDNLRRRGCACLIIAHRLSTIKDSDEIIVLDNGKVVQRGTHEELHKVKGEYAELIAMY